MSSPQVIVIEIAQRAIPPPFAYSATPGPCFDADYVPFCSSEVRDLYGSSECVNTTCKNVMYGGSLSFAVDMLARRNYGLAMTNLHDAVFVRPDVGIAVWGNTWEPCDEFAVYRRGGASVVTQHGEDHGALTRMAICEHIEDSTAWREVNRKVKGLDNAAALFVARP